MTFIFQNVDLRQGEKKKRQNFREYMLLEDGRGRKARQKTEFHISDIEGGEMLRKKEWKYYR